MTTTRKTLMIASAVAVLGLVIPIGEAYAAEHSSTVSHSAGGMKGSSGGNPSHSSGKTRISRNSDTVHHAESNRGYRNGYRGHRGIGVGGIAIYTGDGACGYSYRRWQATGSQYWRSRYYDCIG